jgi:hypothetical protein
LNCALRINSCAEDKQQDVQVSWKMHNAVLAFQKPKATRGAKLHVNILMHIQLFSIDAKLLSYRLLITFLIVREW